MKKNDESLKNVLKFLTNDWLILTLMFVSIILIGVACFNFEFIATRQWLVVVHFVLLGCVTVIDLLRAITGKTLEKWTHLLFWIVILVLEIELFF